MNRVGLIIAGSLIWASAVTAQQPAGIFTDNYVLGFGDGFAVEDFDGDGDLDVATFGVGPDAFKVSMNRGGTQGGRVGTFDPALSFPGNDGDSSQISAGDIDGDDDVDVVSVNLFDELILVINQGGDQGGTEGTFAEGAQFELEGGVFTEDPVLVDLDGDEDLDVVWQDEAQNTGWGLAKNQGGLQGGTEGDFGDITIFFEEVSASRPEPGDIDGDGDTDIVFGSRIGSLSPGGDSAFLTAVNQGGQQGGTAGNFVIDFEVIGPSIRSMRLARVSDLDDDGDLDVVLADGFSRFATAINQGGLQGGTEGDFLVEQDFFIEPASDERALEIADIDNDGDNDVILVTFATNHLLINEGVPAGGDAPIFSDPQIILENVGIDGFTFADFDQDNDFDILLPGTENFFTISWNRGGRQQGETGQFTSRVPVAVTSTGTNPIVGSNPQDIAIADLNNDGLPDFATANRDSDDVAIVLNTSLPNGSAEDFSFSETQLLDVGEFPLRIRPIDLEGDNDIDLVASSFEADSITLFRNQGGMQKGSLGTFVIGETVPTGDRPEGIAVADFDEDGDTDFVVAILGDDQIEYFRNQGGIQGGTEGDFEVEVLETSGSVTSTDCEAADIDVDGDMDIVIAGFGASFQSLLNQGKAQGGTLGDFGTARFHGTLALDVENMALGDVDRDGDPDVAFASRPQDRLEIVINPGGAQGGDAGEFAAFIQDAILISLPVEEDLGPTDVLILDIDGDEIDDLLGVNSQSGSMAVFSGIDPILKGNDPELFKDPYYLRIDNFAGVTQRIDMESGDLNADGLPDLAYCTGSSASGRIGVLLNATPRFEAAFRVNSSTVRVRFSEPLEISTATNATNYSISGPGTGTLSTNPDEVQPTSDPLEYLLVWNSGVMMESESLTVEVSRSIIDVDDTPIGFGLTQTLTDPPPPDAWLLR